MQPPHGRGDIHPSVSLTHPSSPGMCYSTDSFAPPGMRTSMTSVSSAGHTDMSDAGGYDASGLEELALAELHREPHVGVSVHHLRAPSMERAAAPASSEGEPAVLRAIHDREQLLDEMRVRRLEPPPLAAC